MENFLKLMTELWRLRESGFRGQVVVNYDGKGPKDLKLIHHRTLEEIDVDEPLVDDLKQIAKKVMGVE